MANSYIGILVRQVGMTVARNALFLKGHAVDAARRFLLQRRGDDGWSAEIHFSSELFDGETVDRMLEHYRTLLAAMADEPARPIFELAILTQAERDKLVNDFNNTSVEFPRNVCLHEQFESQVDRAPDAIAAICGSRELSYGELDRAANKLAQLLMSRGVGPDVMVGILADRSLDMVIGLVAIGVWFALRLIFRRRIDWNFGRADYWIYGALLVLAVAANWIWVIRWHGTQ